MTANPTDDFKVEIPRELPSCVEQARAFARDESRHQLHAVDRAVAYAKAWQWMQSEVMRAAKVNRPNDNLARYTRVLAAYADAFPELATLFGLKLPAHKKASAEVRRSNLIAILRAEHDIRAWWNGLGDYDRQRWGEPGTLLKEW